MGLTRSLSIGASSLKAHQQRFDVISNNLANVNTYGFKSGRVNFEEFFNQTVSYGSIPISGEDSARGGVNPMQFGLGVKVGSVQKDMSQGNIEITNRPLDLALNGDGFFVYSMKGRELYSRSGAITSDRNGNLVDATTGAKLMGYNVKMDAAGKQITQNGINSLNDKYSQLKIDPFIASAPIQTTEVKLSGNLSSDSASTDPKEVSITIYNNRGESHVLKFELTKVDGTDAYTVIATLDGDTDNPLTLDNSTINFNDDGTIQEFSLDADGNPVYDMTISGLPAGFSSDLKIKLGDDGNLLAGLTNFAGPNTTTFRDRNGNAKGDLQGLSVDSEGMIWGSFTNGKTELIGQVAVAKFINPEGLLNYGSNMYAVSPNSGDPSINNTGEQFDSVTVMGAALEQSNVDVTQQFTDMISTQRGFEAAARTITVSDSMLQEVMMLKR